eukprot:m.64818 g.64818  ORF g.64818 m.64818 type:complete len:201 (+) comp11677_c0_seq1:4318-4920(+)
MYGEASAKLLYFGLFLIKYWAKSFIGLSFPSKSSSSIKPSESTRFSSCSSPNMRLGKSFSTKYERLSEPSLSPCCLLSHSPARASIGTFLASSANLSVSSTFSAFFLKNKSRRLTVASAALRLASMSERPFGRFGTEVTEESDAELLIDLADDTLSLLIDLAEDPRSAVVGAMINHYRTGFQLFTQTPYIAKFRGISTYF